MDPEDVGHAFAVVAVASDVPIPLLLEKRLGPANDSVPRLHARVGGFGRLRRRRLRKARALIDAPQPRAARRGRLLGIPVRFVMISHDRAVVFIALRLKSIILIFAVKFE